MIDKEQLRGYYWLELQDGPGWRQHLQVPAAQQRVTGVQVHAVDRTDERQDP